MPQTKRHSNLRTCTYATPLRNILGSSHGMVSWLSSPARLGAMCLLADKGPTRLLHPKSAGICTASRLARRRQCHCLGVRVQGLQHRSERQAARQVLDQGAAVLGRGHAGQRPPVRAIRGCHGLPGVPFRTLVSPVARAHFGQGQALLCARRDLL